MRINIYSEELTNDCELVQKVANGNTFYGVRLYLLSPDELHHTSDDDDRSAVTFWVSDLASAHALHQALASTWL